MAKMGPKPEPRLSPDESEWYRDHLRERLKSKGWSQQEASKRMRRESSWVAHLLSPTRSGNVQVKDARFIEEWIACSDEFPESVQKEAANRVKWLDDYRQWLEDFEERKRSEPVPLLMSPKTVPSLANALCRYAESQKAKTITPALVKAFFTRLMIGEPKRTYLDDCELEFEQNIVNQRANIVPSGDVQKPHRTARYSVPSYNPEDPPQYGGKKQSPKRWVKKSETSAATRPGGASIDSAAAVKIVRALMHDEVAQGTAPTSFTYEDALRGRQK